MNSVERYIVHSRYLWVFSMPTFKHVCKDPLFKSGWAIHHGDTYYTNEFGNLHRNSGPALIRQDGEFWFQNGLVHRLNGPARIWPNSHEWWVKDYQVTDHSPEDVKWLLVKGNPENILAFKTPSRELQEYVIQHRPDFIHQIPNLDPFLEAKYSHEVELAGVDL